MAARTVNSLARPDMSARMIAVAERSIQKLPGAQRRVLWRNVIERYPREKAFADHYVVDLLLSERWAELDAFAPQVRRYRSPEIDLRYIDVAIARHRLDEARGRLDRYVEQYGVSPQSLARSYQLAFSAGDFTQAARFAQRLSRTRGLKAHADRLARRASTYADARARLALQAPPGDYDVYLVNLDSDTERMARAAAQLDGIAFTRIPGVKGSYLPDYALGALTRNHGQKLKGTAGCFLSHIVVWERVVASGRPALVLEDDAHLLIRPPQKLAALGIPKDFDLCFANERMLPDRYAYRRSGFVCLLTEDVARTKPKDWSAAGTDGYFISPEGARLLLARIVRDGIAGDVDWRLVAYSIPGAARKAMAKGSGFFPQSIAYHDQFVSRGRLLRSYVLAPSLVRQFDGGSVRLWDNELPHAHMAGLRTRIAKRRLQAGLPALNPNPA